VYVLQYNQINFIINVNVKQFYTVNYLLAIN